MDEDDVMDDKYIVFKRGEFQAWLASCMADQPTEPVLPLADAVVIRRQDLFAGPALAAYAACIAMVAKAIKDKRLLDVADYFHRQAILADAEGWKLPD